MEVETILESLTQPGALELQLEVPDAEKLPVILVEQEAEEKVVFDLSAIRDIAPQLRRGVKFSLHGQCNAGLVQIKHLQMKDFNYENERLQAITAWPGSIQLKQRRNAFRATLRMGMEAIVELSAERKGKTFTLQGDLKDLSASGCLADFSTQEGSSRIFIDMPGEVTIRFPNGDALEIGAETRHVRTDNERQALTVGFEFREVSSEQEQRLWYLVREIERESARSASDADEGKPPSELFVYPKDAPQSLGRRENYRYATPAARKLARIAGYLDSQLVALQQGQNVNSRQLSVHADRLLDIYHDDPEALLFASRCMHRESPWVLHGLSSAIWLLHLVSKRDLPRYLRKAMVAAAMVHDLGKGMLPPELWRASTLSLESYEKMQAHVSMLRDELDDCRWLSDSVTEALIGQVNERLDGSGYPQSLAGEKLPQLARMGMVVDVFDAMSRGRPDRPALTSAQIYRHLLTHPHKYDPHWVRELVKRFGLTPVGSLVRFASGDIGWVTGLDNQNKIREVRLTEEPQIPDSENLGEPVYGDELVELGEPRTELVLDE